MRSRICAMAVVLPKPGRRAHQHQLDGRGGGAVAERGARHLRGDGGRRAELGFEDPGCGVLLHAVPKNPPFPTMRADDSAS
jgi:hypothetical protein